MIWLNDVMPDLWCQDLVGQPAFYANNQLGIEKIKTCEINTGLIIVSGHLNITLLTYDNCQLWTTL